MDSTSSHGNLVGEREELMVLHTRPIIKKSHLLKPHVTTTIDGSEPYDQMEHEAFLAFWLSNFVFPEKQGCSVSKHVFSVAVRLARGERIALAPAVLACLYRDLGKVNALSSSTHSVDVRSLFKLVQVWIWERFKSVGPRPGVIPNAEPRIARWSGLRQGADNVGPFLVGDDFDWRPYTKPLRNWNPPRFYNEKAKRVSDDEFARCVRVSTLDGFGFKEDYYPNRVALQFGLAQDLPGLAINFTNRALVGTKKHIASRLTTSSVSAAKYRDWWMKSVKEPAETFNASNTGDDDDDVPLKVLPLSQVFQKLGDGMKKAEQLTNKKRKRASEDDNENAMDRCQTQYEEDDDDNITIAQRIKCRKKCENTEGGEYAYAGVEVDNNVPDLPQKLASGDETVAVPEIKRMSVENDETSSSDPLVASNRIAEKEEEVDVVVVVDDGRLNQRKLGTDDIALKLEARILKVEKTLAKIRQWKMGENQTKTPVSA
ncbi:BnaC08g48110D [Brassica napus]|uniref:BnaC08g48110D protein n=1 Tax=Brassica napus TaxID=3708 RepID=A0A078IQ85_BRANA|nr:BnaC08g48110D [Brassica napus]